MPVPGENIQSWSPTALDNGTADTLIAWPEGQTRASVNNSARGMMAAHAKDRNLQNGSIVTTDTANAQAFVSGVGYTVVPTGLRVLLKIGPGLSNTTTTTLNMDGIGAVTIKVRAVDLKGGELVAGMFAELLYDGTNWVLLNTSATAGASAPVLITNVTINISTPTTTVDFTTGIDGSYDAYELLLHNIVPTNNATELWLQMSEDAGVTFPQNVGDYKYAHFVTTDFPATASTGNPNAVAIQLTGPETFTNLSTSGLSGTVKLWLPSSTTVYKYAQYDHTYISTSNLLCRTMGSGAYCRNTNAINAIRFKMLSGTIASGAIKLYGIGGKVP